MKRHSAEEIVRKLEQADALKADGCTTEDVCRKLEISTASYHQWRKKYRGMDIEQAKRLKDLEKENQRLKTLVADLTLDKQILKEVAEGKF